MALIQVGPWGYDMRDLDVSNLWYGAITNAGATSVRVALDGSTFLEFGGSFSYNRARTEITGGTITRVTEVYGGVRQYEVTGLSYSATRFIDFAVAGDNTVLVELLSGNDTVTGSDYTDILFAAEGDDLLVGGGGADGLSGHPGNDTITGDGGDDAMGGGDGEDVLYGFDGKDAIYGGAGNDIANGNVGADTLWGDGGGDDLRGGRDNDLIYGMEGDDPLLNGNIGNDTVYGAAGNDSLWGGQDNDRLYGEAANDWLSGDLGADTLTGGAGADLFVFAEGGGNDIISDFSFAQGDRIRIALTQSVVSVSDSSAGAVLNLGQGATVTFAGFQAGQLAGEWITYG